jgi:hypothetical protein
MTSQLPDDMFIENSKVPEQLAAGSAMPQPGIVVDGESPRSGSPGAGARIAVLVVGVVAALVAVAGLAIFLLVSADGRDVAGEDPVASAPADVPELAPPGTAAAVYDKYIAMANDDSIFLIIPRTEEGWDYFRAFMYKITDYKVAESIGGPLTDRQFQEMQQLESRFLALDDLDLTVDITLSDGTHFVHDGQPPSREPAATPSA